MSKEFVLNQDYRTVKPEHDYRIVRKYTHKWLKATPTFKQSRPTEDQERIEPYVSFTENGLVLHVEYKWNGSNIVVDTPGCMRASAVHDAWCQAMGLGILQRSEKNWDRGVEEYLAIAKADGLSLFRRVVRRVAMFAYGELRY